VREMERGPKERARKRGRVKDVGANEREKGEKEREREYENAMNGTERVFASTS
jgi:hypothetical protein